MSPASEVPGTNERPYLIVPMQPTPNGRLHIGHASGAYLRADVIARSLRRRGREAAVVSGSDVHENWILLDAHDAGRDPAETCWRFHDLIGEDLRSLEVDLDEWINPLDDVHSDVYREVHEKVLNRLAANGSAHLVTSPTPRSRDSGRYVVGVWLLGACPRCLAPGGGNACEQCGFHFQPAEILDARSRLSEGPLDWADFSSWYLQPSSPERLVEAVQSADVSAEFATIAIDYIRSTGGAVRLSQPGPWGIGSPLAGVDGVLCNPYYTYSVYCAEAFRRRRKLAFNAFDHESDVITVGLFGIDNTVGGIAASAAIATEHGGLKPFDHLVVNHFLNFEGYKCSTSRKHGIWVGDLLRETSVTGDELRYYISHLPLEVRSCDFDRHLFLQSVNELRRLCVAIEESVRPGSLVTGQQIESIVAAVAEQDLSLAPGAAMSLSAGVDVFDRWLRRNDLRDDVQWWTGVALLAEPFMPGFASRLWARLGRAGRPSVSALTDGGPLDPPARSSALTFDEISTVARLGAAHA